MILRGEIRIEGMVPLRRESYITDLEHFKILRTSLGVQTSVSSLFSTAALLGPRLLFRFVCDLSLLAIRILYIY